MRRFLKKKSIHNQFHWSIRCLLLLRITIARSGGTNEWRCIIPWIYNRPRGRICNQWIGQYFIGMHPYSVIFAMPIGALVVQPILPRCVLRYHPYAAPVIIKHFPCHVVQIKLSGLFSVVLLIEGSVWRGHEQTWSLVYQDVSVQQCAIDHNGTIGLALSSGKIITMYYSQHNASKQNTNQVALSKQCRATDMWFDKSVLRYLVTCPKSNKTIVYSIHDDHVTKIRWNRSGISICNHKSQVTGMVLMLFSRGIIKRCAYHVWKSLNGGKQHIIRCRPVACAASLPDGSLVTGHDNGSIRIWNAATGKKMRTIRLFTSAVIQVIPSCNHGCWIITKRGRLAFII